MGDYAGQPYTPGPLTPWVLRVDGAPARAHSSLPRPVPQSRACAVLRERKRQATRPQVQRRNAGLEPLSWNPRPAPCSWGSQGPGGSCPAPTSFPRQTAGPSGAFSWDCGGHLYTSTGAWRPDGWGALCGARGRAVPLAQQPLLRGLRPHLWTICFQPPRCTSFQAGPAGSPSIDTGQEP